LTRTAARLLVLSALAALALPATALAIAKPHHQPKPFLDVRQSHAPAKQQAPIRPATAEAAQNLENALGTQGVVSLDRVTGTPRVVAKLNGYLTGPSGQAPARIALGYVRGHPNLFGSPPGLHLVQSYNDIAGITHLIWQQRIHGIPLFDNDLRANVAPTGG
jgi:extracellular elastinolytic metalloproteinase